MSDPLKRNERPTRPENWTFGFHGFHAPTSDAVAAWYERHEATVDRWLTELEQAGDPWWQSAEHAAFCLVSSAEDVGGWDGFSVRGRDLHEGGTFGFFGSVAIFFDQLVEALRRFAADGLIPQASAERWLHQMQASRGEFLRRYEGVRAGCQGVPLLSSRK